jgi:hypothetical protein
MSIRLIRRTAPVLLAGALLAGPGYAQTPATPAAASAAPAAPTHRDTMVETRITELHKTLKITPAEQKPFDDFAAVMRANAQHMDELVRARQQSSATATAVDQMHAYGDMAQAHAEDMQKLVPAFATLYDALSPAQKKLADQSFRQFSSGSRARS